MNICNRTASLCQWPLTLPQRSARKAKEEPGREEALWRQCSDSGIWDLSPAIFLQPRKHSLIPTYVAAAAPRNVHVWPLYNLLTNTPWKVLFTQLIEAETETQPYHVIFPASQSQCHHESLGVYSQWADPEQFLRSRCSLSDSILATLGGGQDRHSQCPHFSYLETETQSRLSNCLGNQWTSGRVRVRNPVSLRPMLFSLLN